MKRIDLILAIEKNGAFFVRHGSRHDIYANPITNVHESIPRHREIKERMAKKIIKNLS